MPAKYECCLCLSVYWSAYVVGYHLTVPLLITGSSRALCTSCEYVGCKHNFDCPRSRTRPIIQNRTSLVRATVVDWPAAGMNVFFVPFEAISLFKGVMMSEMLPLVLLMKSPAFSSPLERKRDRARISVLQGFVSERTGMLQISSFASAL